eukprot:g1100.t1
MTSESYRNLGTLRRHDKSEKKTANGCSENHHDQLFSMIQGDPKEWTGGDCFDMEELPKAPPQLYADVGQSLGITILELARQGTGIPSSENDSSIVENISNLSTFGQAMPANMEAKLDTFSELPQSMFGTVKRLLRWCELQVINRRETKPRLKKKKKSHSVSDLMRHSRKRSGDSSSRRRSLPRHPKATRSIECKVSNLNISTKRKDIKMNARFQRQNLPEKQYNNYTRTDTRHKTSRKHQTILPRVGRSTHMSQPLSSSSSPSSRWGYRLSPSEIQNLNRNLVRLAEKRLSVNHRSQSPFLPRISCFEE